MISIWETMAKYERNIRSVCGEGRILRRFHLFSAVPPSTLVERKGRLAATFLPRYSTNTWYRLQRKQRRNLSFSTYKVSPSPLGDSGSVQHKYPGHPVTRSFSLVRLVVKIFQIPRLGAGVDFSYDASLCTLMFF